MTATYSLAGGLSAFLEPYHDLFQDQRLTTSFDAATSGILSSGSPQIRQMARLSPNTRHDLTRRTSSAPFGAPSASPE